MLRPMEIKVKMKALFVTLAVIAAPSAVFAQYYGQPSGYSAAPGYNLQQNQMQQYNNFLQQNQQQQQNYRMQQQINQNTRYRQQQQYNSGFYNY